jgi:acetate kinase
MLPPSSGILVLNAGSTSLRFALVRANAALTPWRGGQVKHVGHDDATLDVDGRGSAASSGKSIAARDHAQAVDSLLEELSGDAEAPRIEAVGHRVVHGMSRFEPELVTPALLAELHRIAPIDPDHLPVEVELIEAAQRRLAAVPQVACFDTLFHRDLPRVAAMLPIPRRFEAMGIRRYGFHGLSYAWLMDALERRAGTAAARGHVILAHLGGGASLAAIRDGRCIDTTMSFTPTAGIVMATRPGDLDPGLGPWLERTTGMTSARYEEMINRESGLLGVSETSGDMVELLKIACTDIRAAEAIDLFCYQARKAIGGFAAALGGLDTLVFSGGIGEHADAIRARLCDGLQFLGVELDAQANAAQADVISTADSRVTVHRIATDEAHVIARSVRDLLARAPGSPA